MLDVYAFSVLWICGNYSNYSAVLITTQEFVVSVRQIKELLLTFCCPLYRFTVLVLSLSE